MIRVTDHTQRHLFDPWAFLSPKRRRWLEAGWPGLFRTHLLETLPVDQLRPFFREDFGRPSKELHTVLGVLLLQQTMDLTDTETVEQLAYNIQWHYALDLVEESDEAKTISAKTLWTMRQRLMAHNLDEVLFDRLTDQLARVFAVDTAHQRLDSVHIRANMRRLGRIGIFSRTIVTFLVNLKRHHRGLFETVSTDVLQRYCGPKALAAFARVKPTDAEKTLKVVSADLFELIEQFKDQTAVGAMHSYKLMQRVLAEQCQVHTDPMGGPKVTVNPPASVPADSLQNPSDPEASYSGHKGQGYQVQVMETFRPQAEGPEASPPQLNLITHVAVQTACEGDARALAPAIADAKVRGLGPQELVADTAYGSDANHQAAAAARVELVAPTRGGAGRDPLSDFVFDAEGLVTRCPAGHAPEQVFPPTAHSHAGAAFALERCRACPRLDACPVKLAKRKAYLRYSGKRLRLARRRAMEATEAFTARYRWRAGIEATMSQYDRRTGVKRLRVRGLAAVRFGARLKAAGLNLLRAAQVWQARTRAQADQRADQGLFYSFWELVKERIQRLRRNLGFCDRFPCHPADLYLEMAA